jgi:hypothetical protein
MCLTREKEAFKYSLPTISNKRKADMPAYKNLKKKSSQERVLFGKCLIKAWAKECITMVKAKETQLKNAFGQWKITQRVKHFTGK